jgi:predicted Zn-dependent protease
LVQDFELINADVDGFMRRVSPGGIPGNNLFVDHVHPSIEGQQLVSWVILDTAVKAGLVPLATPKWEKVQPEARVFLRDQDQAITPRYRAMGVWGVGRLYYWTGKSPEAYVALLEAWQTVKDVPEIPRKLGLLEVERGNGTAALEYFAASQKMEPDHPWALLGMARAFNLTGKPEQALETLQRLPASRDQDPGYHAAQGRALLQLDRATEGIEALQKALRLAPEVPQNELALARALNDSGKRAPAVEHLRNFLRLRHLPETPETIKRWLGQSESSTIKDQQ